MILPCVFVSAYLNFFLNFQQTFLLEILQFLFIFSALFGGQKLHLRIFFLHTFLSRLGFVISVYFSIWINC